MELPTPHPGLVIRYAYLWRDEADIFLSYVGSLAMRFVVLVVAMVLSGCGQPTVTYTEYTLPSKPLPFYASAERGSFVIYAGYGYDREVFNISVFDLEKQEFVAHDKYKLEGVDTVCEGPDGIILSGSIKPVQLTFREKEIAVQPSSLSCPSGEQAQACAGKRTAVHRRLPGQKDVLAICYAPERRKITFHVVSADGVVRDLGKAGTLPGGRGQFTVTPGTRPSTFLTHHTHSLVADSAVMIDAESGELVDFEVPDLSEARPSRGFGAGSFGVTIHPVHAGVFVEGASGSSFLLQNGTTRKVATNVAARSVRVVGSGCRVGLVVGSDDGGHFRLYDICRQASATGSP